MKKLYYSYDETWGSSHWFDKNTIDMFLEKANKDKSCPFNQLNLFMKGFKFNSFFDALNVLKHAVVSGEVSEQKYLDTLMSTPVTAKTCPGLKGILQNSYVIKSPCDYHISVIGEQVLGNCPMELLMQVESHPSEQFEMKDGNSLFPNMINIKFKLPIRIRSTEPVLFLQPSLHQNVPWNVVNGVFEGKYINYGQPLHINTLVRKDITNIIIKAGDPIAYMWSPKKLKLTYTKDKLVFFHRKFIGS